MGAISQALALGSNFEHEGKTFTLSPWTLEIQGAFERYLEGEIVAGAYRAATYLPAELAERAIARVMEKVGLKRYTFGTPEVGDALSSPVHMTYLIFLMLKKNHPEVTLDWVKEVAKTRWNELVGASNRANGVKSDPNEEEEAKMTTTSPSASAAI